MRRAFPGDPKQDASCGVAHLQLYTYWSKPCGYCHNWKNSISEKKSDIDINQLVQALNKHFISAAPETTAPQGVALKQLARRYYSTSDIGKGDYEQEIINLNERMRKQQCKYNPIGRGKYKALLFQLNDAVELLQTALKNEKAIPRDTAALLAQGVLEDVLETAVLKKNN